MAGLAIGVSRSSAVPHEGVSAMGAGAWDGEVGIGAREGDAKAGAGPQHGARKVGLDQEPAAARRVARGQGPGERPDVPFLTTEHRRQELGEKKDLHLATSR